MEAHRAVWGPPLAIAGDHGKANLSCDSKAYLELNNIEILPAGPGNPKGNGAVESAFSDMKEVIGTVSLETSSPRALEKGVPEKVVVRTCGKVKMSCTTGLPRFVSTIGNPCTDLQSCKYTAEVSKASSGVPWKLPLLKTQGSYFS